MDSDIPDGSKPVTYPEYTIALSMVPPSDSVDRTPKLTRSHRSQRIGAVQLLVCQPPLDPFGVPGHTVILCDGLEELQIIALSVDFSTASQLQPLLPLR